MTRTIKKVEFLPKMPKLLNVAAYARVSSGKDAMLHSLSAQVSYYSEKFRNTPDGNIAVCMSDEAATGTKDNREQFQKLLEKCRAGSVDLILTKSISRFARNTVTLLETIRELKDLGVDVYFEEQNIHSLSADGELMLTILASYAQERKPFSKAKIASGKSEKTLKKAKSGALQFSGIGEMLTVFWKLNPRKQKSLR